MPCRAACNYCAVMYEERIHMHASIHPSTIHVCAALRCASCCVVPLPYGLLFRLLVLADRDTPGSCFMHLSCTFRLVPAAQAQGWPGRPALAVRVLPREPCVAHGRASCDMHASRSNEQLASAVQCSEGIPRAGKSASAQWASQPARDKVWGWVWAVHRLPVCPLRPRQLLRSSDLSTCGPSAVSPLHTPRAHVHGWACPNLIMHCPGTGATWTVIERSN